MTTTDRGISRADANGVAIVTLARPASANALAPEMVAQLLEVFTALADDRGVRAVLLRGDGDHFCSGGDVRGFAPLLALSAEDRRAAFAESMAAANAMILAFAAIPVPVVTACQGAVAGGGLAFALAADMVFADTSARFLFSHQRVGLPPDGGVSAFLPGLVGARRATELVLTAATLDAEAALALGLVSRIVAPEELRAGALAQAERLASGPAGAIRAAKRLLHHDAGDRLATRLAAEREAIIAAVGTPDFEEGVRAFLERRPPRFPSAYSET